MRGCGNGGRSMQCGRWPVGGSSEVVIVVRGLRGRVGGVGCKQESTWGSVQMCCCVPL